VKRWPEPFGDLSRNWGLGPGAGPPGLLALWLPPRCAFDELDGRQGTNPPNGIHGAGTKRMEEELAGAMGRRCPQGWCWPYSGGVDTASCHSLSARGGEFERGHLRPPIGPGPMSDRTDPSSRPSKPGAKPIAWLGDLIEPVHHWSSAFPPCPRQTPSMRLAIPLSHSPGRALIARELVAWSRHCVGADCPAPTRLHRRKGNDQARSTWRSLPGGRAQGALPGAGVGYEPGGETNAPTAIARLPGCGYV